MRGLLSEFGIVLPLKAAIVRREAVALPERGGYWPAVVAIGAKNARMALAMLHRGAGIEMPPQA